MEDDTISGSSSGGGASGHRTPPLWGLGTASLPSPQTFEWNTQSFGLASPRHLASMPPSMHVDIPPGSTLDAYPLFNRRGATTPGQPSSTPSIASASSSTQIGSNGSFFPPVSSYRKPSLLACSEPLLPPASVSSPYDVDAEPGGSDEELDEDDFEDREGSDSPMVLGSPSYDVPMMMPFALAASANALAFAARETRSRSTSDTMSVSSSVFGGGGNGAPVSSTNSTILNAGGAPASPVMVARALQGQRTPPPFLQRKLFHGMNEEGADESGSSSGNGSGSGSSAIGLDQRASRAGVNVGKPVDLSLDGDRDDEEDKDDATLGFELRLDSDMAKDGSSSASGEEGGRVVRRPVSRKPNLLPKSKSHLRVLQQLQTEKIPADQLEIASEATLHRLSRSGTSTIPSLRASSSTAQAVPSDAHPNRASTSQAGGVVPRPTPNRFPEQVDDNDEDLSNLGNGSSADEDEAAEVGSDWGGMSMGYGTEDEEERKAAIWTGFRGGSGSSSNGGNGGLQGQSSMVIGKSPGSEKGRMEVETPSTPSWHSTSRPGKRKMTDDRFEPYAQALKRRAVSPASGLSPSLGSPILSFHQGILPTPPPLPLSIGIPSNTLTLPISIPSPTGAHSFFSTINSARDQSRSRAGSPILSSSSLSTSAGNGRLQVGISLSARIEREREEMERSGDGLGRMTLG